MPIAKYALSMLVVATLGAGTAFAQPYPSAPAGPYGGGPGYGYPQGRKAPSPSQILQQQLSKLTAFLSGQASRNPAEMQVFLAREIAPAFEVEQMSRWILGRAYAQLTPPQRQQFQAELMKMFFGSLARLAQPYAGQPPRVQVMQPRPRAPDEVVVSARISQGQGYPVRLDFRFMEGPKGWKI